MAITEKTIRQGIKYLAEEMHTSEAEVYRNIQDWYNSAKLNPTSETSAYMNKIPHAGLEPTVEEVLMYMAAQIKSSIGALETNN